MEISGRLGIFLNTSYQTPFSIIAILGVLKPGLYVETFFSTKCSPKSFAMLYVKIG